MDSFPVRWYSISKTDLYVMRASIQVAAAVNASQF